MAKQVTIQVEANVQVRVWQDPNSAWWVASCEPLALTGSGETFGEMQEDFNRSLQALMSYLLERGEIEEYLSRRGWKLLVRGGEPLTPGTRARFDVPWSQQMGRPSELAAVG